MTDNAIPLHDGVDADAEKRLSKVLRLARRARGWSQVELAERAGLSGDTIRNTESGRRSATLGVLAKLAEGLQIDLATLWRGIDTMQGPRLGLDGLTKAERDLVTAFARVLAERRADDGGAQ